MGRFCVQGDGANKPAVTLSGRYCIFLNVVKYIESKSLHIHAFAFTHVVHLSFSQNVWLYTVLITWLPMYRTSFDDPLILLYMLQTTIDTG